MTEIETLEVNGWVVKVRHPEGSGPHPVILLLHGWTGDENSMWVFAPRLPLNALLVAPRAPHPSISKEYGGYSWIERKTGDWSAKDDYTANVAGLRGLLDIMAQYYPADYSKIGIAGFSQGAAMTYVFALHNPGRVTNMAGLAGFLPDDCEAEIAQKPLQGIPVFVAHGTQDETVPVERAQHAADMLGQAGGVVTYCESDVGHKLGANCFRGLKEFFA